MCYLTEILSSGPSPEFNDQTLWKCNTDYLILCFPFLKIQTYGFSGWIWEDKSLLWGWQITEGGCPERLWSLLPWRYSKAVQTQSWVMCLTWSCLSREFRLDDIKKFLPTSTILWFPSTKILLTCLHKTFNYGAL